MPSENKAEVTATDLEYSNKQRATAQVREINRGLTRLKRISSRPNAQKKAPLETDKTGSFIVVPVGELQSKNIEEAVDKASKSCSALTIPKKAKKKWFNWQAT